MYLILNGQAIGDRETLHDTLSRQLSLPEYYGRNLDALYDCLTDLQEPLDVIVLHEEELREALGGYAGALLQVLKDSAAENGRIALYQAEAIL